MLAHKSYKDKTGHVLPSVAKANQVFVYVELNSELSLDNAY